MKLTDFEAQVLNNRSRPPNPRLTPQTLLSFLLWQGGGLVAIAACSRAPTFTLAKLQLVYAVVALAVGGAEALQQREWVLYALGVLGILGAWFRPPVALLVWIYGAIGYGKRPRVLAIALCWFALVVAFRAYAP